MYSQGGLSQTWVSITLSTSWAEIIIICICSVVWCTTDGLMGQRCIHSNNISDICWIINSNLINVEFFLWFHIFSSLYIVIYIGFVLGWFDLSITDMSKTSPTIQKLRMLAEPSIHLRWVKSAGRRDQFFIDRMGQGFKLSMNRTDKSNTV